MKKSVLKKSSLLSVCILFILLFTSCEKDLYDEAIMVSTKAKSQKISVNQVMSEITNPLIKNYITNGLPLELGFSEFKTTSENYFNFIKIIKENDYITYTFLINGYEEGKPYLKYFIITKEDGIEKAGFATYIPDSQIDHFDVNNFTGKIQISNLQNDVKGETQFVNSQPVFTPQGITCTNSLSLIAHSCGLEGNHAPGEPCYDGVIRSYWEIIVVVTCSGQTDMFLAAPSQFMGENSGGGSLTINANVMVFLNGLNDDQLAVLQNNPSLITYLEENDASPESVSFVLQLITIAIEHDLEIDFNPQSDINQNFSNLDEFSSYIQEISLENEDDTVGTVLPLDQDKIFSTKTIQFSPFIDLTIEVISTTQPTFSLNNTGCTSYFSNVVVGNTWVQNSMFISKMNSSVANNAEITLVGYNNIGIKIEGLEFGIKQRRKIEFLINKTTGNICCSRMFIIRQ